MTTDTNIFKLSDKTIAEVARLLQVAILSGTDIVDNLRYLELTCNENGLLDPTPEFSERIDNNVSDMLRELEEADIDTSPDV